MAADVMWMELNNEIGYRKEMTLSRMSLRKIMISLF
jgi:hypothetical protein